MHLTLPRALASILGALVLFGAACSSDDQLMTAATGPDAVDAADSDVSDEGLDEADHMESADEGPTAESASNDVAIM